MKIIFTGHRQLKNTAAVRTVTEGEVIKLIEQGADVFLSGMALGYDLLTAQLVLDLKSKYPQIKLIAILPCSPEAQTKSWSDEERTAYNNALSKADEVITLSQTYFRGCMHSRNRYLVENGEYCICYLTDESGGTAYTVKEARKKGLTVINVAELLSE